MRTVPDTIREKVMAVAPLFAEVGLDGAKMEDVAAVTGVPKATLYYYFEGKEHILAFLFGEVLDELGRAVACALDTDGSARERLEAVVLAHLQVIEALPTASLALQFDLGRAARLPIVAERTDVAFVDPVRALLVEGATDGSLRPVEHPRLVATAILGAVVTTGLNALAAPSARTLDEVAEELTTFVLRGVAT